MSKSRTISRKNGESPANFLVPKKAPRSLGIAASGINTSREFAQFMSALMSDVLEGAVTAGVANAAVNAGGKLLKVVELQLKYGTQVNSNSPEKVLNLTGSR